MYSYATFSVKFLQSSKTPNQCTNLKGYPLYYLISLLLMIEYKVECIFFYPNVNRYLMKQKIFIAINELQKIFE